LLDSLLQEFQWTIQCKMVEMRQLGSVVQVLVFLSTFSLQAVQGDCDEAKTNGAYFACRDNFMEGSACNIITNIIVNCSSVLSTCRSEPEIKDINVDLIKANIAQNKSLEGCPIVEEYRAEGLLGSKRKNCTAEETTHMKRSFNNCSYGIAGTIENLQQNLSLPTINQIVCNAVENVTAQCKELLNRCDKLTDKEQIYTAQLENVKTFIQDKVGVSDEVSVMDLCKISTKVTTGVEVINDVVNSAKKIKEALVDGDESASQQHQIGVETSGVRYSTVLSVLHFLPFLLMLLR